MRTLFAPNVRIFCWVEKGELMWEATTDYTIQLSIEEGRTKLAQRGQRLLYCIRVKPKRRM